MPSPDTLIIAGDESQRLDPDLPDGGIPLLPGVQSFQVFRAARAFPELSDGKGYTYHHHVDMACWRGLLYVAWNSCERDEDVWPSRELVSTSSDGTKWSQPQELFPQGTSTSLRMYFFCAPNDRMLAIAGLRTSTEIIDEETKGSLVVREISPDHKLGSVFALQKVGPVPATAPPLFTESSDAGFVEACNQLLSNTIYLEQQDRGRLLGNRKMKWHDERNWSGGQFPTGDTTKWVPGKAYTFFTRKDGAIVGISKMGFTTFSHDAGKSWSQPAVPETLVTGKAKVWSQQTPDGKFILAYNPSRDNRYPLALTTSDDGIHFSPLRIVQGELPIQRYAGEHRSIGPQYARGISAWSTDGSRKENCLWLVYSMSKEDIWVSRVPLPIASDLQQTASDNFKTGGRVMPGWNTYCPKWSMLEIDPGRQSLYIFNDDPHDFPTATRLFAPRQKISIRFDIRVARDDPHPFGIDLAGSSPGRRPVQIELHEKGRLLASGHPVTHYPTEKWLAFAIDADAAQATFSLTMDGQILLSNTPFVEKADDISRLIFRAGAYRGIGGAHPVDPQTDRPVPTNSSYQIRSLRID